MSAATTWEHFEILTALWTPSGSPGEDSSSFVVNLNVSTCLAWYPIHNHWRFGSPFIAGPSIQQYSSHLGNSRTCMYKWAASKEIWGKKNINPVGKGFEGWWKGILVIPSCQSTIDGFVNPHCEVWWSFWHPNSHISEMWFWTCSLLFSQLSSSCISEIRLPIFNFSRFCFTGYIHLAISSPCSPFSPGTKGTPSYLHQFSVLPIRNRELGYKHVLPIPRSVDASCCMQFDAWSQHSIHKVQ